MSGNFTASEQLFIQDYFTDPSYPQPHGEVVSTKLLAAMIASGQYEMEDYPRLVEASLRLTKILIAGFRTEVELVVRKVEVSDTDELNRPSSLDSQGFDPIPF
ncbi:hypothetical protein [Microcoleus sp. CAWBG58]|uniref:hypothetical protein n=1 Tax=Microcoleus sp. CAWBG58 TaxID=2841651 RepID=UPI0025D3EED8|nr:hypothetical protein [Microcoleus sp. CAWBG58]